MKLEHAKEVLAFLERIERVEGAGYGGIAELEIARQQMRVAVELEETSRRNAMKVLCFSTVQLNGYGNLTTDSARNILNELEAHGLRVTQE